MMLVIGSGIIHSFWNLFAKQSSDKEAFLWMILLPTTAALLPVAIRELALGDLPWSGYGLAALTFALQGGYALLLSAAYRHGDLSQSYPIMRGTSTLLIPILGVVLFGESLTTAGWLGLSAILAGFVVNAVRSPRGEEGSGRAKPFLLAVCVGLCTTCYVIVDKANLVYLTPAALLAVSNLGFMAALTVRVCRGGRLRRAWASNRKEIMLGSVLSPGSYLIFLIAMKLAPVSYLSPMREIGIVSGTVLGIVVLKEKRGLSRLASSFMIAAGIMIVGFFGA